jgi:hypothetical protein
MSESDGHEVIFTVADDGRVGMFPSAEAIEAALAPSDTEQTRAFTEDALELELGVELKPANEFVTGPWQRNRMMNVTTVLMPNEATHDVDRLRRSLVNRFTDLPINTAMPLAEIVETVKRHLSYGFH